MDNFYKRVFPITGWEKTDPRWDLLIHFCTRVREAGVSLVSHGDRARILERHLLPSLEALEFIPESGKLLDVGSGGGFPAIPIALAKPGLEVVMVESNSRKSAFLTRVSRETSCASLTAGRAKGATKIVHARVEDLCAEHNSAYNIITARAVVDIPLLIEWTRRFLAPSGRWILWKGQEWRKEVNLEQLKIHLLEERPLSDGGRLIVIEPILKS
ncbi:16S rRNA (guanine(527)-N(7))-methyltransferase RsmG [candidate division KSB1 bacterium]|nr:MAG: 16S rRNA (guanine(527)-N(7))-methyltransferase RsmG [candidate division KSB1 bacterium]